MAINEKLEFFTSIPRRSAGLAKNLPPFFVLLATQQISAAAGTLGGTRDCGDSNTLSS
jgi:hypothetical protein